MFRSRVSLTMLCSLNLAVLLLSLISVSVSGAKLPSGKQIRRALNLKTSELSETAAQVERYILPPDYKVAGGFLAAGAAFVIGFGNPFLGFSIGLVGAFLAIQSSRVRFVFDKDSMEVCYVDKNSVDGLRLSGENFAVGGRNRWHYSSFTEWALLPSPRLPVFMYFRESQTPGAPPRGQFHLFPVIMDGRALYKTLQQRVGVLPGPAKAK